MDIGDELMKQLLKFLKSIFYFIAGILQFILWHMPISVAALAGLYFAVRLLANPLANTINITNYTFAVVATFSTMSFAFARAIDDDEEAKSTVQYCGERFLHSSILFVIASIVKYFLIQKEVVDFTSQSQTAKVIIVLLGIIPGTLYLGSVTNAIAALRELNALLFRRKKPGQELMKLF